jgi:hypothetical protein
MPAQFELKKTDTLAIGNMLYGTSDEFLLLACS